MARIGLRSIVVNSHWYEKDLRVTFAAKFSIRTAVRLFISFYGHGSPYRNGVWKLKIILISSYLLSIISFYGHGSPYRNGVLKIKTILISSCLLSKSLHQ